MTPTIAKSALFFLCISTLAVCPLSVASEARYTLPVNVDAPDGLGAVPVRVAVSLGDLIADAGMTGVVDVGSIELVDGRGRPVPHALSESLNSDILISPELGLALYGRCQAKV